MTRIKFPFPHAQQVEICQKDEPSRAIEIIARFVRAHPDFYIGHHSRGVVVAVDAVQDGEIWTEFQTVMTMSAAREALGY
jgi:hypothetical protein